MAEFNRTVGHKAFFFKAAYSVDIRRPVKKVGCNRYKLKKINKMFPLVKDFMV